MERQIITTKDGSHSIHIPEMDEQYHSIHGSIQEAEKVYIEYGLESITQGSRINLFEMGFGTGLNALLTYQYAKKRGLEIIYHSIEKYPLSSKEISSLNYSHLLNDEEGIYDLLHAAEWGKEVEISSNFHLKKIEVDLEDVNFEEAFDVVYFDAFAPEKQPHLWSLEVFSKLYQSMKAGAVLTTYCVKGEVRRRLQELGFQIEKLPGPEGGKREVLRAVKI